MKDELEDGEFWMGTSIMTSRDWASNILRTVATATESGRYPNEISAFDLGRALGRALVNCREEDPMAEVLRGIERYQSGKGDHG